MQLKIQILSIYPQLVLIWSAHLKSDTSITFFYTLLALSIAEESGSKQCVISWYQRATVPYQYVYT